MDKFTQYVIDHSKKLGLNVVLEADEQQNTAQPVDDTAGEQQSQPQPPANNEDNPFPERFVYVAGLLQKALLDKFPSLMNIEAINQGNVGQAIQNMESLMKQAGMLDNIDTTHVNL